MRFDIIPGVSLHARQRAVERFGRDPERHIWLAAVQSILDRRALLLAAHGAKGNERWRVALGPIEAEVWWSPDEGMIVTVLPAGEPAMNPRRARIRHDQTKGGWGGKPYRRERPRVEDWR